MKNYVITHLQKYEFDIIVTLLDYTTQLSHCLKSIELDPNQTKKLLIDTCLCSGMNSYRFIETTLKQDGTIDLDNYNYVNVDNNILNEANKILKNQESSVINSVLTKSQINNILNKG